MTLAKEIAAAGNLPSLRGNVKQWRAQMAAHKHTISEISRMLGYSNAYIAAHPAPPKVPPIQHLFGGDVGEKIPAFLASVMAPFRKGGMIKSFDRGGWLEPGLTYAYNGTNKAEKVGGDGNVTVTFELVGSGNSAFDQLMIQWLRKNVKINGGTGPGAVDRAFGYH